MIINKSFKFYEVAFISFCIIFQDKLPHDVNKHSQSKFLIHKVQWYNNERLQHSSEH